MSRAGRRDGKERVLPMQERTRRHGSDTWLWNVMEKLASNRGQTALEGTIARDMG